MPHFPKPYARTRNGRTHWYVVLDGKHVPLGPDREKAFEQYHSLMASRGRTESIPVIEGSIEEVPFAILAAKYLESLKLRSTKAGYTGMRFRIIRALKILGTSLRVSELRKHHLSDLRDTMTRLGAPPRKKDGPRLPYSPTTIKDTLAAVQAVTAWAKAEDLISENRIAEYVKPSAKRRSRVIDEEEFRSLLRNAHPAFRRLLIAGRETGCRPIELRQLVWSQVSIQKRLWIIENHKTAKQQKEPRPRIIPLTSVMVKMCQWLKRCKPARTDHVFLNGHGEPYSKDRIVKSMRRVCHRANLDIEAGERIVFYSSRHTVATEMVGKGSDLEVAELLGHTDTRMLKRYTHINVDRLHKIRRKMG